MNMPKFALALMLSCLAAGVSAADNDKPKDQISFQVEVGREVENDRAVAVLSATAEHKQPAALADTLNSTMQWALDQARRQDQVTSRGGGYQTYPVYDDKKIVRWRGSQQLELESQDVDRLSQLVGALQSRLQMQSLRFSVSPEKRRQVEDELIEQALAAYQKRAEIVRKALGAKAYELREVAIRSSGQDPITPMRMEAASMMSKARLEQPAMERGTSRVTVQASGSIRLLR